MIPLVADFAVERKKWLSGEEMVDCLAVCQSLPGAIIINIGAYIGKKTCGFAGAVAAALGSVTPAFVTIILVMLFIDGLGENSRLAGALDGAKAAAAALVIVACLRIGKGAVNGLRDRILAAVSFAAVGVFGLPAAAAIGAGAVVGLISGALGRGAAKEGGKKP
jgi:chromate transporter